MTPLRYGTDCQLYIDSKRVPDGKGGYRVENIYLEPSFIASIVPTSRPLRRIGEQEVVLGAYKVYIGLAVEIEEMSVIRRNSDGLHLRIVSNPNDRKTPKQSRLKYNVLYAEKYTLPNQKG